MPTWPDGVTLVTIRHRPVTTGGRTFPGSSVTARASERLWADDGSILPADAATTVQADGSWEIQLPAVDVGLRPSGAAYRLTEHVPGAQDRSVWVAPMSHHAPGPVDLADVLTPQPTPGGGITIQTGPATDPSMAEIADDPDSEFRASLTGVITPVAVPAAEQAAATYLASEPAVTDAAATAAAQAIDDQGGITDPVIAAALADPASASHQLAVGRGELVVVDTDHPTLEAALTATAEGGTLEVRRQYTRSTPWTIDKPVTVRFARGGRITQTAQNGHGIVVTVGGVTIEDAHLIGTGATVAGQADGIRAAGTSAAWIDGVTITRPRIQGWSKHGIYVSHLRGLRITDPDIQDVTYAGIMCLSVQGGHIRGGTVQGVTHLTWPQSYGIALTRDTQQTIEAAPHTTDVTVQGVTVDGVQQWEGIDTHGGRRLRILDCTIRDCYIGIALVPCVNELGAVTWAPKDILVSGCTIDSTVSDGSRSDGIRVNGAAAEQATGVIITGCTITDHGTDTQLTTGAILAAYTTGLIVSGNTLIRPTVAGVSLNRDNYSTIVTANTVEDVWTQAQGACAAVYVRSINNDATVSGTQIIRGSKVATLVNQRPMHAAQPSSTSLIDAGGNQWSNATAGLTAQTLGTMRAGFYGATPIPKPSGVAADAASIHAALVQLGLIS